MNDKRIIKNGVKRGAELTRNLSIAEIESEIVVKHTEMSQLDTPKVYVKEQQGFDYVDEGYMRYLLNLHFPVWTWEIIKYEFIGDKSIAVHGRLTVMDKGIERRFDAVDAHRIASNEKGYVDIGNDLKSANTDCFKVAVNRLCNIADDVYRKRIEDISLDKEQLKTLNLKLKKIKDENKVGKVRKSIDNMIINSTNYSSTIRRLDIIIGEQ